MATPDPTAAARIGGADVHLDADEVTAFVLEQLDGVDLDGQRVCVLVPDATRSCPLPMLVRAVHAALHERVAALEVVVALGTHAAMDDVALAELLGHEPGRLADTYPDMQVRNHEWWDPDRLVSLGRIPIERVAELSEGRLREPVDVRLNRAVVDHDVTLIVGPVFPHEVVGFSGGNKYLFPGIAGQEIIDLSHWLGALITSAEIIGTTGITPVRALIHEAAALVPSRRLALCVVVASGTSQLHAAAFGTPEDAWAAAAEVSAAAHVTYLEEPVARVLSLVPEKYDDMWTGAKGFYKVEPVVAEGGEVILYAPHITEISAMHPDIVEIGYHCRDYFLARWDEYKHVHWGDLAHSTHLRGAGTYDPETGVERFRAKVTLATSIPREQVERANLAWMDPDGVDVAAFEADPDTLVVPNAGEILYRLRE